MQGRSFWCCSILGLVGAIALASQAHAAGPGDSPILKRIAERNAITIGHREGLGPVLIHQPMTRRSKATPSISA